LHGRRLRAPCVCEPGDTGDRAVAGLAADGATAVPAAGFRSGGPGVP
jgi:hypothetical protein